jgi:hypothetical protein
MRINSRVIAQMVLALGLIFCVLIFTSTWRANTRSQQTITVIGSAKKDIVSDMGVLRGSITLSDVSLQNGYSRIKSQLPILMAYLNSKGINKTMIEVLPITNFPNYEFTAQGYQTGKINNYTISQRFQFKATDVNKVKQISLEISDLIIQGLSLQMDMPEYYFTKISDMKIQIQAEAARDAKMRAEQMAASTNSDLGPMRTAKMGVLQITPKNSNVVSDYGINDVSSIEKEITAVVHASFEID